MKVALIQETIDPDRGGAETSTRQMAERLAELGLDVSVVCAAATGPGAPQGPFDQQGVRYEPLSARGVFRSLRSHAFMQAARQFCSNGAFDVVHAISPALAADIYQPRGGTLPETVRRSTAMVRTPLLRPVRRLGKLLNVRQRLLGHVERVLLTQSAIPVHVAALSDYVRRQVTADYGVPPQRVHLVYNGVDIVPLTESERAAHRAAIRRQLALREDERLVLFVAHNFRLKGLAELIRACALRTGQSPDWRLVVIGRDRPGTYAGLAERVGVARRVCFLGSQPDLRPWYAAADALAHPTWYDPCSRVVLEALGVGLPVVTTRWNGAAEVLKPGVHGELIDNPADTGKLAAAIARALQATVQAACLADAARMREHVSMRRHARELLALYELILASRRSRTASACEGTS
jgi:UDP-glucose:(heptosyl)LPS alpha-1,3-glucosyltransferase